jgi:hypothetical protein
MLEALAQETPHPDAPERDEGPWMGLINPFVQAAKEGLEGLQKVAAEALIHATLFGRDALLTAVKVGLVCGQIFLCLRHVRPLLLLTAPSCGLLLSRTVSTKMMAHRQTSERPLYGVGSSCTA